MSDYDLQGKPASCSVQRELDTLRDAGIKIVRIESCCKGRCILMDLDPCPQDAASKALLEEITANFFQSPLHREVALNTIFLEYVSAALLHLPGWETPRHMLKGKKLFASEQEGTTTKYDLCLQHALQIEGDNGTIVFDTIRFSKCTCTVVEGSSSSLSMSAGSKVNIQEEEKGATAVSIASEIMESWISRKAHQLFTIRFRQYIWPITIAPEYEALVASILEEQKKAAEELRGILLTIAAGLHPRLGSRSHLRMLSSDELHMICGNLQMDRLWKPSVLLQHVWDERDRRGIPNKQTKKFLY